tara:strand:- start:3341 stop:4366 length:1026 start_codon:yes stop_codon:yes gene_type:complete
MHRLKLSDPIHYRGHELKSIAADGNVLAPHPSLMVEIIKQVGFGKILDPNFRLRISNDQTNDLKEEWRANYTRAAHYTNIRTQPFGILRDCDNIRRIAWILGTVSGEDDDSPNVTLERLMRDLAMAKVAYKHKNFQWAYGLCASIYSDLPNSEEEFRLPNFGEGGVALAWDYIDLKEFRKELDMIISNTIGYDTRENNNSLPFKADGLPGIDKCMKRAIDMEQYEMAGLMQERYNLAHREVGNFYDISDEPIFRFVVEKMLLDYTNQELASGVDTPGNFHLYDRDGTSVFSMTLAVDRSPSFSFDKSMADVMLTLGHEERYVLTFGRELFFGAGTQYHRFT